MIATLIQVVCGVAHRSFVGSCVAVHPEGPGAQPAHMDTCLPPNQGPMMSADDIVPPESMLILCTPFIRMCIALESDGIQPTDDTKTEDVLDNTQTDDQLFCLLEEATFKVCTHAFTRTMRVFGLLCRRSSG